MYSPLASLVVPSVILALWYFTRRLRRRSLAHLPGPPPGPWLVGNNAEMHRPTVAGEADAKWASEYGLALRTRGPFHEDVLWLADPKGLQFILNTRGYKYPKTRESRQRAQLTTGRGIVWEEGPRHAQQRKIMGPAFSHSALRGFLPLFFDLSRKLTGRWKEILEGSDAATIDVVPWLSRTTMDAIGEAALAYPPKSLEGTGSELTDAYHGFLAEALTDITENSLALRRLLGFAPLDLFDLITSLPTKDFRRINQSMAVVKRVAKTLVRTKVKTQAGGKEGGKDVMSLFIKANMSEQKEKRLLDSEVEAQITTLLLAGHETSSSTLSWILYELSLHPDAQHKIREEIEAARAESTSTTADLSVADLDAMPYTQAVMKETLRFHPNLLYIDRTAAQDDVIPLMIPQRTLSGETVTAIPVSKGQNICISFQAYNRVKEVWGEDPDVWRPERFLEALPSAPGLGVYGNVGTFSSGLRACIGWRFAVLEMQAIVITLLENFEFAPAPGDVRIKPAMAGLLTSLVVGKEGEGAQMPLRVRAVGKDFVEGRNEWRDQSRDVRF